MCLCVVSSPPNSGSDFGHSSAEGLFVPLGESWGVAEDVAMRQKRQMVDRANL